VLYFTSDYTAFNSESDSGHNKMKNVITIILSTVVVFTIISAIVNQVWYYRMKKELVQWTKKVFVVNYVEADGQVRVDSYRKLKLSKIRFLSSI
jgi:hypothetical protein